MKKKKSWQFFRSTNRSSFDTPEASSTSLEVLDDLI